MSFPYLARTILKYKSPHATDLSFAKDETIRVTGPSPDDEDWLIGETLDGEKKGGFPKDFIEPIQETEAELTVPTASTEQATSASVPADDDPPPLAPSAPAPPSPKIPPAELVPTPAAQTPIPSAVPAPPVQPTDSTPQSQAGEDAASPPKQSMKDRLAFFNAAQNKAAPPPPPIKPKPATGGLTWSQRQKLRQEQEAKEREAGGSASSAPSAPSIVPTPAPAPAPQPATKETDQKEGIEGSGMSAADAVSSISKGGSLRERMAALQGSGAFGSPTDKKPPPPAPSGKVWKRPPAPEPEPEAEDEDGDNKKAVEIIQPTEAGEGEGAYEPGQKGDEVGGEEEEEETEEEKEKARRAAIAARMAKLGARGPMGIMPPSKPVRKPTKEVEPSASLAVEKPQLYEEAPAPIVEPPKPTENIDETPIPPPSQPPATAIASTSPPSSIPMPAVPRRTAPPRRRTPAPAAASSPAPPSIVVSEEERQAPPEPNNRFETVHKDGTISPPPQVMVANEEKPIPRTEKGSQLEHDHEEAGRTGDGIAGASAAGIALAPVDADERQEPSATETREEREESNIVPHTGAAGEAESIVRGTGAIITQEGQGEIISSSAPPQEIEEGVLEGGSEKDDIMREAEGGHLVLDEPVADVDEGPTPLSPDPIAIVPIHPPADDGADYDTEEEAPPPPPRPAGLIVGLDEVELKHEHDHEVAAEEEEGQAEEEEEEEEEDIPPPPPKRISMDKPLGPRPFPSPGMAGSTLGRALPPPPVGNPLVPPRDEEQEEREAEGEGDNEEDVEEEAEEDEPVEEEEEEEEVPPPPPARIPPPIQTAVPARPTGDTPISPQAAKFSPIAPIASSPKQSRSLPPPPAQTESETSTEAAQAAGEDEDASRRSGIAARMAKLGGIKFGMPPPTLKKQSLNVSSGAAQNEGPVSPRDPTSPIDHEPPIPSPSPSREVAQPEFAIPPPAPVDTSDETPEQEAARRRATLARLRAGGALGFGMFNHGPKEEQTQNDSRDLEQVPQVQEQDVAEEVEEEEEEAPPPPPPGRHIPTAPPILAPPAQVGNEDAPPPPARPSADASTSRAQPPAPISTISQGPQSSIVSQTLQSPVSATPPTPVRSPSGRRPPVPSVERRISLHHKRMSSTASVPGRGIPEDQSVNQPEYRLADEPAIMAMNEQTFEEQEAPPPPPPNRPVQPQITQAPASPRRSTSSISRTPRASMDSPFPPTPQQQQQQQVHSPAQNSPVRQMSMSRGGRPGYDQLKEASATYGTQVLRAAQGLFSQGRKAYLGDGSPAGFVMVALDQAHIARSNQSWGQVVLEQEAGSVLKRYDEPRPGDIAAFFDAKFKGKKGLTSYNQHVGSVEEPLVGIVSESEERKHKLKVLQVERGISEEVSYRCEDLKSGRIVVYRPGL